MKKKVENWDGFANLLTNTLNEVIAEEEKTIHNTKFVIDEKSPMSYACGNCKYMWLETTYKSSEYREGYSCPKCGSESIAGDKK